MSAKSDAQYQKGLIETFLREAEGWLQQMHVALDELQQGPPPDRHQMLVQAIKAGVTTIAASAATVGLREVEFAATSAVPFVEAVQNPSSPLGAADFTALCKQFGGIHGALTGATVLSHASAAAADSAEPEAAEVPTGDLLALLYRCRSARTLPDPSGPNLLQSVIDHVEELDKNGIERCTAASLTEFIDRLLDREAVFVEAVRAQVPTVVDAMSRLKAGAQGADQSAESLRPVLAQAAHLVSSAQQLRAPQASFFSGLQGFLTVAQQGRVSVAASKYEAVESRLRDTLQALQARVDAGRAERMVINGILPR